jgi:hypothetical protein
VEGWGQKIGSSCGVGRADRPAKERTLRVGDGGLKIWYSILLLLQGFKIRGSSE